MTLPLAAIDWTALLAQAATKAKPPDSWRFDTDRQRWQHGASGRPVSPARIAEVLAQRQEAVKESMAEHGRAFARGAAGRGEFVASMRQESKSAMIQARLLAIGGRENATPKDWGTVGQALRQEYGHLETFADVAQMSEEYAANRASLYGGSAIKNAYAVGQRDSAAAAGFDRKRRTGPADDTTCQTCSEEIAAGWVDIDEDGWQIGHTDCLANDRCEIEYGRGE